MSHLVKQHRIRWKLVILNRINKKEKAPVLLRNCECSSPLTSSCEFIPSREQARCCCCCLFLRGPRRREEREWVGDWINYVLSPFSWLKSTLLPLDSLCLCLRTRQMDRVCHPVQALPSLLSQTWTSGMKLCGCFLGLIVRFVFYSISPSQYVISPYILPKKMELIK